MALSNGRSMYSEQVGTSVNMMGVTLWDEGEGWEDLTSSTWTSCFTGLTKRAGFMPNGTAHLFLFDGTDSWE